MFTVGSDVMYGSNGVCRIEEIRSESFSGEAKDYYILSPADDPKTVIYVPTDAPTLTAQMRRLLSQEEVQSLIRQGCDDELLEWINDPRSRSEMFRGILQSGDRRLLLRMLRTIHARREQQSEIGRKLYAADEQAFARAERLLHGEIAAVMRIHPDEVQSFIHSQLRAES